MQSVSVCVIGAGAAGICAARHLAAQPQKYNFHVFEQAAELGGTWVYTEDIGIDKHGLPIHSSMYKSLRTNVPKEIMSFPDYLFPEHGVSYIHHTEVLEYLKNYADHFNLYQYIKFDTVVKVVMPKVSEDGKTTWSVTVQNVKSLQQTTLIFDAVMVCNGHYAVPDVPNILGIESFQGQVLHSHDYRQPEALEGLRVVVLGAASSGLDISLELSEVANEVYLSHSLSEPIVSNLPDNVKQVPSIASVTDDGTGFKFHDGMVVKADVLIYCTGYKFDFPFLRPECGIKLLGRRIKPLYKHLIHIEHPTMCFVGIPLIVLPFPLFDYQVRYFLKTLDGSMPLPSKIKMEQDAENDFEMRLKRRMPPRHAHKLGCLQWEYVKDLSETGGFPEYPPVIKDIYEKSAYRRKYNLMEYKNDSYSDLFKEHQECAE